MEALAFLFSFVMIAAIVYVIWGKTRATASVMTSQDKNDLRDSLTNFLTHRKYLSVSQSENLMTFAMDKKASCIIAFFLLLIGFIPGILYLVLGGSTKTLTVQFSNLQGQQGWNVRIQGQRSIVNRVRKVVGISQAALSPMPVHPGYTPVADTGQGQYIAGGQPAITASQPRAIIAPPLDASPQVAVPQPVLAAPAMPVASNNTAARACPNCGSEMPAELIFCQSCGTRMP